ncbi:MAG: transcription-repair coupling factor [Ruminococcaceae bacterium]|nr:transcription-repair coupling factor [Oscillospiraceae bacterium]
MKRLSRLIRCDKEFSSSVQLMREQISVANPKPLIINGLTAGASTAYIAEAIEELKKFSKAPALIIVGSESERERFATSLCNSGLNTLEYKARDFVFHNISASHDTERERLSVLCALMNGECDAVVTTPSAALSRTIPEDLLASAALSIECGDEISPEDLTERLISLGFARVELVESAGQFSRRGGIIDVWAEAEKDPVRIEFFGDEIDRIVYFDPATQRSLDGDCNLSLLPATEVLVDSQARARLLETVNRLLEKAKREEIEMHLKSEKNALESSRILNFRDKYIGIIYDEFANLFSYFESYKRCAVFVVDTNGSLEELKSKVDNLEKERASMLDMGVVSPQAALYTAGEREYTEFLNNNLTLHINPFSSGLGNTRASGLFGFRCRRTVAYGDNPSMLFEDLSAFRKAGYRILIFCENEAGAESLISSLAGADIASVPIYDNENFDLDLLEPGQIAVDIGKVDEGYDLISARIAVLSMSKDKGRAVMANRRRQRILRKAGGAGQRLMSYADLSVGDYVVHANYGIGLFEGMQTVTVDGITKDYITIKYAGTDKLFVPCDRLEYIGKYIGEKDKDGTVKLSHMGGGDWTRAKTKAKSAAKDIAKDLIRLYAERQKKPGFAFPADSDLEDEFAASFDFEETESQLTAIEEIKADMMKPIPMNRLLCGDVGFGKTEVALRAAFKAVMGGKQVAILVPTTILALQHLETASSRMRAYPITVEMISRFRTPKQQENILRRTRRGEIDILIGTHKLLSKKVEFRDLGLLIVDEEQRFGVSQKEKLKEMAKNVDVLTLSATPIPRTLNMAMNGISDMSILDEAPGERRPVQTYVLEHDDGILFDAMQKELLRGGQVLYLYNKIDDIAFVAGRIMRALPDARVAFAHGQMDKDELEDIWQLLVRGEIDILVCTTIIETGVDLPNANTLIIENADRMGLSQLHQIRGRVGRSSRQAYAYFTYRSGKALSEVATKRLSAIREFAEFGAGFKVALRDLEIRGAGNLLGAEQHGYIDSVGYDLYVKLLNEAVLEETGKAPAAQFESTINIKLSANIPESYISQSAQRMEMYKKISLISEPCDLEDIIDEFIDRFGNPPKEVVRLVGISLLRAVCSKCKIKKVELNNGTLTFLPEKPELAIWSELFEKYAGLTFKSVGSLGVVYRLKSGEDAVEKAIDIIKEYYKILCFDEQKEDTDDGQKS